MTAPDQDPLNAKAMVPSRVDSVPAARSFLTKLLMGWAVEESVIDDAALLTTELMANALEHGQGLLSLAVGLEDGVLHVGVQDRTDGEQPRVLAVDETSPGGRGMWIVNIVACDWGTQAGGETGGKTVWFELSTAGQKLLGPDGSLLLPEQGEHFFDEALPTVLSSAHEIVHSANLGFIEDLAGSYTTLGGTPVVVYQDKLSALVGDFARTLLTDFPIQGILDRLVERIVDALPFGAVGLTLTSPEAGTASRRRLRCPDFGLRAAAAVAGQGTRPVCVRDRDDRRRARPQPGAGLRRVGRRGRRLRHRGSVRHPAAAPGADPGRAQPLPAQPGADEPAGHGRGPDPGGRHGCLRDQRRGPRDRTGRAGHLSGQRPARPADRAGQPAPAAPTSGACRRAGTAVALEVAVLFADLDRFKQVNDTYGHGVGDELLMAVAARLSSLVRPGDTLARVSGDEFVILCEGMKQTGDVEALAERIDEAFTHPFVLSDLELTVTASVGIAYSGPGVAVTHQLIVNADIAMYQAKRNGGAGHQMIDLREAGRSTDRSGLEQDLHAAFARDELHLAYQPIVRSGDGLVVGAEALLRWNHATRGAVSPLDIVGVAEENGLIVAIGAWVLEQACLQRGRWLAQGHALDLSVNVSTRQLMGLGFCDSVAAVLAQTGMDPAALVLELTEAVFIRDGDRALTVLERAQDARHPTRPGRLRYGLLLAQLSAGVPGRHPQDRPQLRPGHRDRRQRRSNRRGDHPPGPRTRPQRRGRGRGDAGPARADPHGRLRLRAGLLLRQADDRCGIHRLPGQRRRRPAPAVLVVQVRLPGLTSASRRDVHGVGRGPTGQRVVELHDDARLPC